MSRVMVSFPEDQVVEWTTRLSAEGKRQVLQALIPEIARFEALVDYGSEQIRQLCAKRGIDWDGLAEGERERLIDDILHEE